VWFGGLVGFAPSSAEPQTKGKEKKILRVAQLLPVDYLGLVM